VPARGGRHSTPGEARLVGQDDGLDVTLRLEGPLDDVPGPAAATAYRVVQESLPNALRYAAGARVAVVVRGGWHVVARIPRRAAVRA
jgi:signal transduction histidine kinase